MTTGIQLRAELLSGPVLERLIAPQVSINGRPAETAHWGDNTIHLEPGRYAITCWYDWANVPANRASAVVDVPAGVMVPVTYQTRWLLFQDGKMGVNGAAPKAAPGLRPYATARRSGASTLGSAQQAPAHEVPHGAPAGWRPDPWRVFEYRYWNGAIWTEHVSIGGETLVDPSV